MNKETIKKALTEGKMKEELVIFKSNVEKHQKKKQLTDLAFKGRPTFSKSQSLQTSLVSRPVSSSSKTSKVNRLSPTINKQGVTSLKNLSNNTEDRPSSKFKQSERKVGLNKPQIPLNNLQAQSEYMVASSSLFPRKSPPKKESVLNPIKAQFTPVTKRMESASVKNITVSSAKQEPPIASSYSHLFRQSRYNTPSVSTKTFASGKLQGLSEPPAFLKTSSRKRKPDSAYNALVGAFAKKKTRGNSKNNDDKKSTLSSIKTGSNYPPEERRSYGSKKSGFDNEVPHQKLKFQPEVLHKDLMETNLLINKLKSVTENRVLNLGKIASVSGAYKTTNESESNPPSSSRVRDPVMPSSDLMLEQMYRDLIKRTNTLYREIYTD